jgi:hypothetical protein
LAGNLERKFDLAVVVTLVPNHVLHKQERVIVVLSHGFA